MIFASRQLQQEVNKGPLVSFVNRRTIAKKQEVGMHRIAFAFHVLKCMIPRDGNKMNTKQDHARENETEERIKELHADKRAFDLNYVAGKYKFCPVCGAEGTLVGDGGYFVEAGCYLGDSYCSEGDADQYRCTKCDATFMQGWSAHDDCGCSPENPGCECDDDLSEDEEEEEKPIGYDTYEEALEASREVKVNPSAVQIGDKFFGHAEDTINNEGHVFGWFIGTKSQYRSDYFKYDENGTLIS